MRAGRYEVAVETAFAASHQLRGYRGPIEPLHGHNFRVRVTVGADELDGLGLAMDFVELEEALREVVAPFDHRHLNEIAPFDELNPSAENLARWIYERLEERLADRPVRLRRVEVWEAPRYRAAYEREAAP